MRFGKYRSDEKILHDEYFSDQPSAAFLLTARLVLLCLMSASFVTTHIFICICPLSSDLDLFDNDHLPNLKNSSLSSASSVSL